LNARQQPRFDATGIAQNTHLQSHGKDLKNDTLDNVHIEY